MLQGISVTFNVAEEVSSTGGVYLDPFDISVTPVSFPVIYAAVAQLLSISRNEAICAFVSFHFTLTVFAELSLLIT